MSVEESEAGPFEEGVHLTSQCLDQLDALGDPEWFPARLFVLLASTSYLDNGRAEHLLAGIHQVLAMKQRRVPLIGSTAAALYFDGRVHESGAVLVCLASKFLTAKVEVEPVLERQPEDVVETLLSRLYPTAAGRENPNSDANQTFLAFFPNATPLCAPDILHGLLWRKAHYRVPIVGGVSSANDPKRARSGLQFAGSGVHRGAFAVARIDSGTAVVGSLGRGLEKTGQTLHVKRVSPDRKYIEEFEEPLQFDHLDDGAGIVLLGEKTSNSDLVKAITSSSYRDRILMLREVEARSQLEVLRPSAARIAESTLEAIDQSRQRGRVQNPAACLTFGCASHFRHRSQIGLDLQDTMNTVSRRLGGIPMVGGFFDGEAGLDETGRSIFVNWGRSNLLLGDELRARAVRLLGFEAIARSGPKLANAKTLESALRILLETIRESGFVGAMISLIFEREQETFVVAQQACGKRFSRIVDATRRPLRGSDILGLVARNKRAEMIVDSRTDSRCDRAAIHLSGIVSQYIAPLLDQGGTVLGVLQVDLGDLQPSGILPDADRSVLDSLSTTVSTVLASVLGLEELRILNELDSALKRALLASTEQDGVQIMIDVSVPAFRVAGGHVRIFTEDQHLTLLAGRGEYYSAAKVERNRITLSDRSRTSEAFQSQHAVMIVNNAVEDPVHSEMKKRYHGSTLAPALDHTRSLAIAVFRSLQGKRVGTINLLADRTWFFQNYHSRCLRAFADHVGFLIDHLEEKQKAHDAASRLEFLLAVGPRLATVTDFRDTRSVLTNALMRFRDSLSADVASLYLWEERDKRFVLRAESGWADSRWVGAARHEMHVGWIGSSAMEAGPRLSADIAEYKASDPNSYTLQMFGAAIGPDQSVEGLSLPLRVRGRLLGVAAFHRLVNKRSSVDGFSVLDPVVVQHAADGLVSLLLAGFEHSDQARRVAAAARQRAIYFGYARALDGPSDEKPEDALCRLLCEQFGAECASLYLLSEASPEHLSYAGGFGTCEAHPDEMVQRAFRLNQFQDERKIIGALERVSPELALTEGAIIRLCVSTRAAGKSSGVIDMRWAPTTFDVADSNPMVQELCVLSNMIGSAHQRHQLSVGHGALLLDQEKIESKVQAMGAMVFQFAHRFKNLLQDLNAIDDDIEHDGFTQDVLVRLKALIRDAPALVDRPLQLVNGDESPPQAVQVRPLLSEAIQGLHSTMDGAVSIKINVDDVLVQVNPGQVAEAFRNIVDNARRAILAKGQPGVLAISAIEESRERRAKIVFFDTGVGMTKEDIDAALRGFVSTRKGGVGVGVLLSNFLLRAQGGTLDIHSCKGVSTTVTVTLPLAPRGV